MEQYIPQLWLMTGTLVLGLAMPFIAVLVLDAIVGLFRHEGPAPLMGAIVMTVVVGGGGYALWVVGMTQTPASTTPDTSTLIVTLLAFTVPIAVLAFIVRTVRAGRRTRHRY